MFVLFAATAFADDPALARTAWDRPFAMGTYAVVRGGDYQASGLGGRARWQPSPHVGVEGYLEATVVDVAGGFRHDYPNGFNVFVPVQMGPFRARAFLGFCDVLSFVEPAQEGAPRADDVLIGAHGGLGAELAVAPGWSVFVEGQTDVYAGHDRASRGWTGDVGEDLLPFWTGQVNAGVQMHLAGLR